MRPLIFAANWKMQMAPDETRAFAEVFTARVKPRAGRDLWFFPPAVSIEAAAQALQGRPDTRVGAQDIYWEPKGAFTGAHSVHLVKGAGATVALVGHSERRHVFGETDAETARKVKALLEGGLLALLCVGEKLEEREAGDTEAVCLRQLQAALTGLNADRLRDVVLAYEPVWAIGTGKNATPEDAASVHKVLRAALTKLGHPAPRILYGGSVNAKNVEALLAQEELDGVLVGGASLDVEGWGRIVEV